MPRVIPAEGGATMNVRQAAQYIGVSDDTFRRWLRTGKVPFIRLGAKTVRIGKAALDQLLLNGIEEAAK